MTTRLTIEGMRAVVLLVGLAACGRIDFDARATAVDGSADVGGDTGLPLDLVAYYRMEPLPGGGRLADETGRHDAACTSCPTPVPGRIDQALAFDGVQSLGVVVSAPDLELSASGFTVTTWARLETTPVDRACIATKGLGMTYRNAWAACIETDLRVFFFTSTAAADDNLFSVATFSLGAWHHVAIRWDGMRKTAFLDGAEVATSMADIEFDADTMRIGGDIDTVPGAMFGGAIDDLRIYSRALGDAEILGLANP